MRPRVACVTHAGVFDPDPDLPLILAALDNAGMQAQSVAWDAGADWADFDLALVRTPGIDAGRRQAFLRWARAVEQHTRLANTALTLVRNTDRTYLRDLQRQGIAVVDTLWFEPGDPPAAFEQQVRERAWSSHLVGPAVGGAGDESVVGDAAEAARLAIGFGTHGSVGMVQSIPTTAAVSVVMLGGEISHAVAHTQSGPEHVTVPAGVADVAREVLARGAAGEELLYARIDLVDRDGRWLLADFAATGPRLYLETAATAPDLLARAVRGCITAQVQAGDFLAGSG